MACLFVIFIIHENKNFEKKGTGCFSGKDHFRQKIVLCQEEKVACPIFFQNER